MREFIRFTLFIGILSLFFSNAGHAQQPAPAAAPSQQPELSTPVVPAAATAESSATFDVEAATNAYLAKVPADKKARSDAYFEGGYWLILWDFLISFAVFILLLRSRLSARMRDFAERLTRFKPLQTMIYFVQFTLAISLLTLPMGIYEGYFREHKYDLLNQTFSPWFKEQLIMLAINLVLGSLVVTLLFGIVRRLGRNWWVWGAAVSVVFILFVQLIAPVYLFPLFNTYTKLEDRRVREPILSLARANGIPATDVYQVDASRQSNRVSANVSGFLGTQRITLNDNLLRRCSLHEIEVVMGHEMGHYVLNHSYKFALFLLVSSLIMFAFLNWGLTWSLSRWGERWGVRGITDVAVLPLAALLLAIFGFLSTPIFNSAIRIQEAEADIFGINAAQQPDGEAEVALKLGEYRKLSPGTLEEIIFFDHPSGRTRIATAMRWKKEHLPGSPLLPAPSR